MPSQFQIFIDKEHFTVTDETVTGAFLRALPDPDVPEDRDLYKEVPGDEDELIGPDKEVKLKNGMHFFTVPKVINPGA